MNRKLPSCQAGRVLRRIATACSAAAMARIAFTAALLMGLPAAQAHEVRPAYLQLRQTSADTYDVLWKVPGRGDNMRLGLYAELPDGCAPLSAPRGSRSGDSFAERWSVKRAGGLAGGTIRILGLTATLTDVLVRIERLDGSEQVERLTPAAPSLVVADGPNTLQVVRTYLVLGTEHILSGVDHLLFIFGLLLLVNGAGRLIKTVTAFTVSHSVTLCLATLGVLNVPPPPVEAVIALSILFVANEALKRGAGVPSLAQRQPWLVAFAFGLLHGLGFAGGLTNAGLPAGHIPTALLFFSIGVEVGHFAFIGAVLAGWALLRRLRVPWPAWGWRAAPYTIGSVATFWVFQRIAAF